MIFAAMGADFIELALPEALIIVLLGFIGGVLSGFLGSGGAFIMTPGMMNLGVPGILAVGSNVTHKFGKALIGSRSHAELGHVDKKLAATMLVGLLLGVQVAVKVNSSIFETMGKAVSDLYISAIFIIVLTAIAVVILRDVTREEKERESSSELVSRVQGIKLNPVVHFEVAGITVSAWIPLAVAFATGYLAGTIGVGGFIGVPAMIYLLGISTRVAAGTELFLAIFSGAWGAINYALLGYVDLRLVLLLYFGSLVGVQIGALATEIVEQRIAKIALLTVIATSDLGRVAMVPEYLRKMGYLSFNDGISDALILASTLLLFGGAVIAIAVTFKKVRDATAMKKAVALSRHG